MSRFQFRHSRTFSLRQLILLGGFVALLFLICIGLAISWFHRWPFFNAETSLYLVFTRQDISDDEFMVLQQISSVFLPKEQQDFFSQFIQSDAEENIISKNYNGQLFFIQKNPKSGLFQGPLNSHQADIRFDYHRDIIISDDFYRVYSQDSINESWNPSSLPLVLAKKSIKRLKESQKMVAWLKPNAQRGLSYFGTIGEESSIVFFKLTASAKTLNQSNSIVLQEVSPFMITINDPVVSIGALARGLAPNLESFWPRLNNTQLKLVLEQGKLEELMNNPFSKELVWHLVVTNIEQNQVNELLLGTLEDLSHIYPQVVERKLPDDSVIMELVPDTASFLPLTGYNEKEGSFTFPDGRIEYGLDGKVLNIAKFYEESKGQTIQGVTCNVPSAQVLVSISQQIMPTLLFDQAFVSFSQQEFIVCFINRLSTENAE